LYPIRTGHDELIRVGKKWSFSHRELEKEALMQRVLPRVPVVAALVALFVAGAAPPSRVVAQGTTGAVEGTVKQAENGQPVSGARIQISGTTLRGVTSEAGEFRISGVPARQIEVTVRMIGYAPLTKRVVVAAGETARLEFAITVSALQLDQVVVTGTGQQVEARKLGNTVAVITPPENLPYNDIATMLQAREPGLSAISSAGLTGSGTRIRIRGNASLTQSNEPIVFLDGIRVNSGGGQTSRLEDIDPQSVERIEVLKGAAAATLYGTEASNGVIQIFTKRGTNSAARWRFSFQRDALQFPDRTAPNAGYAKTQAQADSLATYWKMPGLQAYQVFEVPLWKDYLTETGYSDVTSGQVNGGGSSFTYFASGRYEKEDGPIGGAVYGPATDMLRRIQTRANFSLMPFTNLRLGLQSGYYNTLSEIPGGGIIGNSIYGTYALAAYARPESANCNSSSYISPAHCSGAGNAFGNQAFMTVRESMQQRSESAVQRYQGVVTAQYTPISELNLDVSGGWDVTNTRGFDFSRFRYDVDRYTVNNVEGSRDVSADVNRVVTLDGRAAWNRDLTSTLSSGLVAGMQVFNSRTVSSGGFSTNLPGPGIEVVGAGGLNISVRESFNTTVNGGFFAQEQLGYKNWSFLTVGGRYDYASAFGEESPGVFYPKAGLSVVPSDIPGWGSRYGLNTLRLRFAWGQSGRQPGAFDKFTTFSPLRGELGAGLAPQNLGNPNLKPEVSTEIEGGFETGIWDNRIGLNVTYWDRTVNDLLIARQFPPSGGFSSTQLANIGQIKANGLELGLNSFLYNSRDLDVEFNATAASLKQTLTSLGGSPVIKTMPAYVRHRVFLKEGDPLGSIYVPRIAAACPGGGTTPAKNKAGADIACYGPGQYPISLNGSGVPATQADLLTYFAVPRDLKTTAVQNALRPLLADYDGTNLLNEQRIGDIFPDWTGTFGPAITWRQNWRLHSLFEWRTGFLVHNLTYAFRNSQHATIGSNLEPYVEVEAILNNPASTPQQRVEAADRYIKNYRRLLEPGLNEFEKGDFMKFRELALTYTAPQAIAARARASSLAITFSARNIALWTPYSGSDPEIAYSGRQPGGGVTANFNEASDSFGMPVPRRFSLLLNLGY
jgi:TonB-dependent starch-binding outer membrane protein SusC